MPFDEKQRAASVAWCFTFAIHETDEMTFSENGFQVLLFIDGRTGKKIGSYAYTGLRMD